MGKTALRAQELLDLLNKVLREEREYKDGMAFIAAPKDSKGNSIWGTDTTTPYSDTSAYRSAERVVCEMHDFDPSRG